MFLAGGYAETSVDAIAHAAGYTTGAVYSNFGGKADLFLAVLESATTAELVDVRRALAAATTDEQRLGVFTTAVTGDPERWRSRIAATIEFLTDARRHPDMNERIRAAQEVAEQSIGEILVALCQALGVPPPSDLNAVARDVTAVFNGYAVRSLYDDSFDLARSVALAVNSLLSGSRSELDELTGAAATQVAR